MNPFLLGLVLAAACLLQPPYSVRGASVDGRVVVLNEIALKPSIHPGAALVELSSSRTGIEFGNTLDPVKGLKNQILFNGSGLAIGDIDGDDLPEIYFCGLDASNQLYKNEGGLRFSKIENNPALACPNQYSTGAVFADVDGDGDLDLLVSSLGNGVRLFKNDGRGGFAESTRESGLASADASMTLTLADVDKDGDLDLYAANFQLNSLQDQADIRFSLKRIDGRLEIARINGRAATEEERTRYRINPASMEIEEQGQPDRLFLNDGAGRFAKADWRRWFKDENGEEMEEAVDWGLAAMFHDIDGDGWPDLYVCNDTHTPDRIWINQKGKGFNAIRQTDIRQTSLSSMGVDFADIDRDGDDDFFVADMLSRDHFFRHTQLVSRANLHPVGVYSNRPQYMKNTLFLNQGESGFAEIGQLAGVEASEWSWSPAFLDVDLDGLPDLLITTGLERSLRNADIRKNSSGEIGAPAESAKELLDRRMKMKPLNTPNAAFKNLGGLRFEEYSQEWGFRSERVSQGMALGDLDGDGDADIVINCMNGPALVYENNASAGRVAVRVKDPGGRNVSIGARLVYRDPSGVQSKELTCGGRYLSGDQPFACFAASSEALPATIEIEWPSGGRGLLQNIQLGKLYEITAPETSIPVANKTKPKAKDLVWFEDVSGLLGHRHHETHFNDFERQPLLPRRLSQSGPGACWSDINRDGFPDLVLGTGRGGSPGVFLNSGGGRFNPVGTSEFLGRMPGDVTAVLWNAYGPAESRLWIGVSNYETGSTRHPAVIEVQFDARGMKARPILPGKDWAVGTLSLGDLDGDGDLDLFAGGQTRAGDYPSPVSSTVLLNEGESWVEDPLAAQTFSRFGIVNASVITDLDQDGRSELVLACEWGCVRVLSRTGGEWTDRTSALGLDRWKGLWQSVAAGDWNGDGRMDLAAGNWGLNNRYSYYLKSGVGLYHGDPDNNGAREILEVYRERGSDRWLPWKHLDTLRLFWRDCAARFPDYESYARADAGDILGAFIETMSFVQINTLETMAWIQGESGFQPVALAVEAQFTPVFGICVNDFNADGRMDLFMAQNYFGTNPDRSRMDAGQGLFLEGDGSGKFDVVPPERSGVRILGEQRSAASADIDADGRMDLVVTQNGNATKLYRNQNQGKGWRVRLIGPRQNHAGVGAQLWLEDEKQTCGPTVEIQCGGGYLSQNESLAVLTHPGNPVWLKVRWPGGKVVSYSLDESTRDISVSPGGGIYNSE